MGGAMNDADDQVAKDDGRENPSNRVLRVHTSQKTSKASRL
jgi:hypothetical protein